MDKTFINNLKQPCKNRGITFGGATEEGLLLNGIEFFTMKEAEDYISQFPRLDIPGIENFIKK